MHFQSVMQSRDVLVERKLLNAWNNELHALRNDSANAVFLMSDKFHQNCQKLSKTDEQFRRRSRYGAGWIGKQSVKAMSANNACKLMQHRQASTVKRALINCTDLPSTCVIQFYTGIHTSVEPEPCLPTFY